MFWCWGMFTAETDETIKEGMRSRLCAQPLLLARKGQLLVSPFLGQGHQCSCLRFIGRFQ